MKTIHKYTLAALEEEIFYMPKDAKILSIQVQNNDAQIWVLVNTVNKKERRTFNTYGTGHDIPDNPGIHVGTYQILNGAFVGHVFEQSND